MEINKNVLDHYERENENDRLNRSIGLLEFHRTKEIILRYLPKGRLNILDVGGATGPYAFWLSSLNHAVHLIEPVTKHVEIARKKNRNATNRLESISIGEARNLGFPDNTFDVVLCMGPLYHLVEVSEREKAILEAKRVLKSNGILFSAFISRFASLLDGYRSNLVSDQEYVEIMLDDVTSGKHRSSSDGTKYFTDAYLHHPKEMIHEICNVGFKVIDQVAIESFGWLLPNFSQRWENPAQKKILLESINLVEKEPSLMGVSTHIMVVSRKA